MAKFKVGDVVRVKSGGPSMTVSHVEDETCDCTWFIDREKTKTQRFLTATLTATNLADDEDEFDEP